MITDRNVLRQVILTVFVASVLNSFCMARSFAEDRKVKVGVILPLTGAFARYGAHIQSVVSHFSTDKIDFVYEDEGCDPKISVTAFKKLSDFDGIKYFLGPWCGSPQSAVAPLLKAHKQLAMLGSSAPISVYGLSDKRMFSTQPSIEEESTFLGKEVSKSGAKSVAIIFYENQFSRAHEAAFRNTYTGKIFETFAYSSDNISDLKSIALKIKQLKPEALYVPDAFPLMAGFVRELHAIGVKDIPIYSVYSAQSDDVLRALGKDGEGLLYSYPDIGEEDALNRFPNLAVQYLVDAVAKCGEDVECARGYLLSTKKFDENGVLSGGMVLKTIRGGKFVAVGKK